MAEEDHSTDVMLALLPTTTDWCKQELPHMTLVYAGLVEELPINGFNELAKDALWIAKFTRPMITLRVLGTDIFGEADSQVNVLRLEPTDELLDMRFQVADWNRSQYTEFNPHATIGPVDRGIEYVPASLSFDRILVAWGDEKLTFQFETGQRIV